MAGGGKQAGSDGDAIEEHRRLPDVQEGENYAIFRYNLFALNVTLNKCYASDESPLLGQKFKHLHAMKITTFALFFLKKKCVLCFTVHAVPGRLPVRPPWLEGRGKPRSKAAEGHRAVTRLQERTPGKSRQITAKWFFKKLGGGGVYVNELRYIS